MPPHSILTLLLFALSAHALLRHYNLTLTYIWSALDGNPRPLYAINGQSPGPLITADEGDVLSITVSNQLPHEATLHWHGVYQTHTPWHDGVPGVTQFSIQSRDTYTYEFTVGGNQYGSYWYHGHFGPSFTDGMRGPLWIAPAAWRPRPYSLISSEASEIEAMKEAERHPVHLMLADWMAEPMGDLLVAYRDTGVVPWCAVSVTLNGRGRTFCHDAEVLAQAGAGRSRDAYGCLLQEGELEKTNAGRQRGVCRPTSAPLEVVDVPEDGNRWLWVNLIHGGTHHELQVSIDEHVVHAVAADGEFVHPQAVHAASVNLGERISIFVALKSRDDVRFRRDYAIRVTSLREQQIIQGIGILRYPSPTPHSDPNHKPDDNTTVPTSTPWVHLNGSLVSSSLSAMDETRLTPFPPQPAPPTADTTLRFTVNYTTVPGSANSPAWSLDAAAGPHATFRQQLAPLLWDEASRGPTSVGAGIANGTVVDIVTVNGHAGGNGVSAEHPFHKHNHKVWIIGRGTGGFLWASVAEAQMACPACFELEGAPRRDGWRLGSQPGEWTAVRYRVDFPAVSMLHCHMVHHFAAGQQVVLVEGAEEMPETPAGMKMRVHAEFEVPVRYGPLD